MMRLLVHIPTIPLFLLCLFFGIGMGAAILYYLFRRESAPRQAVLLSARYLVYAALLSIGLTVVVWFGSTFAYSGPFEQQSFFGITARVIMDSIFAVLYIPQSLLERFFINELFLSNGGFFFFVIIHIAYVALLSGLTLALIQKLRKKWNFAQARNFLIRSTIAAAFLAFGMGLGFAVVFEKSDLLRESHFISHEFNAHLKNVCVEIKELGLCPRTESDLRSLNPSRYDQITEYYETFYHFDEATQVYTWIVQNGDVVLIARPEYYFQGYDLRSMKNHDRYANYVSGPYPPDLPGPWDQFP